MDDSRSGRHPLTLKIIDGALVAKAVTMFQPAFHQIGDCLNAPVRMPGETFDVVAGISGIKSVEHQKRVEIRDVIRSQDPAQTYSCSIYSILSSHNLCCFSFIHDEIF